MRQSSVIFSKKYLTALLLLVQNGLIRQYKNTFLGAVWGLLQPFVHITVISCFFGMLLRQSPEVLAANLVSSLALWTFLSNSLVGSSNSLILREGLLKKIIISRTLFPLSDTLVHAYIMSYSFAAMYAAFILFYPHKFSWLVLLMPLAALPLVVAVLGIAVACAFITPYVRDIPQLINVLLGVMYWTVPIVYPYSMVPESKRIWFEINPLYCLIKPAQMIINDHMMPDILTLTKATFVSLIAVAFGYFTHKHFSRNVVYYL